MAPPSRSARAAVLASSVQRSKPTPYPSKARSALIRRAVVVVLVLVALTLVTISFRSPTSGALHDVQGAGSTALRPFQIAATRVAQPFRDAYDYFDGLAGAKSENERLKKINAELRRDELIAAARAAKYPALVKLLHFENGSAFPNDYRAVNVGISSYPGSVFTHSLTISAGSSSGIRKNAPVVSGDGLVGIVSNVFPDSAKVTLITDGQSFVAARDLQTRIRGVVHTGPGGTLILDQVSKQFPVREGDEIVTDGTHNARFPDLYPYGIPIGRVSSVGATDTAPYLQVQVQPYANPSSLDAVAVLIPKNQRR
ncbi:MAG TPA: rod shape-determining protein MreC [Gaiellaceae bacterium]|nr:rod shape-determining protein MreC [Gaiellaceae bacterium]